MSNLKIISIMDATNKEQDAKLKSDLEEAMLVLDAKIDSVRRALARVDERVKVLEDNVGLIHPLIAARIDNIEQRLRTVEAGVAPVTSA